MHDVVVAGGMESMSQAPYIVRQGGRAFGSVTARSRTWPSPMGLFCAIDHRQMGEHGDIVSAEFGIGREEQDAWALRSHQRAVPPGRGSLRRGDRPVEVRAKRESTFVDADESPRGTRAPRRSRS
jgi:acetyl-CoA C-acetyltransferase